MFAPLVALAVVAQLPSWQQIEQLQKDQKLESAAQAVEKRLDAAQKGTDEDEHARALIELVRLRAGVGGAEKAVRLFQERPWPKGVTGASVVGLYFGGTLRQYVNQYRWEINQRERIDAKGPADLKAWTADQIEAEAFKAFAGVFARREQLGDRPLGVLARAVAPNTYPKGLRDTVRDAVSYLYAEALADSGAWTPEQSNEVFRLDLDALLKPGQPKAVLTEGGHPLARAVAVLDDLEAWRQSKGSAESVLEARIARLELLRRHFTSAEELKRIRQSLEAVLPGFRQVGWWSMGQAHLAEWLSGEGDPVAAVAAAKLGVEAFPRSPGAQRCQSLIASLTGPDYQLLGMELDGAGRRSVQVTSRNLETLHFRAYRTTFAERAKRPNNEQLLPSGEEMRRLVQGAASPVAQWTVKLPATPDLQSHVTYVIPPLKGPGLYMVVASARADFVDSANRLTGVNLVISDITMLTRHLDGAVQAEVRKGDSGASLPGVEVQLWNFRYDAKGTLLETKKTGADGLVRFEGPGRQSNGQMYLIARSGESEAAELQGVSFYKNTPNAPRAALVFTDRSVYRPEQKVFWKAVPYQGNADRTNFNALAQLPLVVELVDPNWQVVQTITTRTNGFGSAAGEFTIPRGRLLGRWQVRAGGGSSWIQVEEYKRPTFEVALVDDGKAARLNAPVEVKGTAKYYFGLPVSAGGVKWRVQRTPQYPWWWSWWGWSPPSARAQTVAAGVASLGADGTFKLSFVPAADPALSKDVTYHYAVEADVTDDGGETRSASKGLNVGAVAVQAAITTEEGFVHEGQAAHVKVRRTDLDGNGRPGSGAWKVLALKQPKTALLPADEAMGPRSPFDRRALQTEGDQLKPRWAGYTPEATLRGWADGAEVAHGDVTSDASGEGHLALPILPAGAYRIRYSTKDDVGALAEASFELVVVGQGVPSLPLLVRAETATVLAGGVLHLAIGSAFDGQPLVYEEFRAGRPVVRKVLVAGRDRVLVDRPVTAEDRGGFSVQISTVRDWQLMSSAVNVSVPWDDKALKVEFSTFRDTLRPGAKETFKITVKGEKDKPVTAGAAEVLAYMYDQSLDIFAPHSPPSALSLYANRMGVPWQSTTFSQTSAQWLSYNQWFSIPGRPVFTGDRLMFLDPYLMGGLGNRFGSFGGELATASPMPPPAPGALRREQALDALSLEEAPMKKDSAPMAARALAKPAPAQGAAPTTPEADGHADAPTAQVRENFAETAFFSPSLTTGADGTATVEFQVPDSVTAWNVWAHALTADLRGGSVKAKSRSVKELMVRPYLPRFLREGDQAQIKVVVNNASTAVKTGELTFQVLDPDTRASVGAELKLSPAGPQAFSVPANGSTTLTFSLVAPRRVGQLLVEVVGKAGDFSDGERRPLPLLPSRMHLAQSRFVTLKDADKRTLTFEDLRKNDDPTRIDEQLVVTVDAQLFTTVLQALPYLMRYPYECSEQTMNRFLSAGIVGSVFRDHPAVASMAKKLAARTTPLETWDAVDPNRKLALEETPWLLDAKGGQRPGADDEWLNLLDPRVVKAERESALLKLQKLQTAGGGFPWFPGGYPSEYLTVYLLSGFAKASEFQVEVPRDMIVRAWRYVATEYRGDLKRCMALEGCFELVTFINYVASSFPDDGWLGGAFTAAERTEMLDYSFKHWRKLAPMSKAQLALTLKRMGRGPDGTLVFDSVMDTAKTTQDEGTFWQAEDRSWLWYRDTIEGHAMALRALTELKPKDQRRGGLVQWLLLNKKLNQWKSTRATAEVIYSLVKYMQAEKTLGIREESKIVVGDVTRDLVFLPDEYTGKKNQLVIPGPSINPATMSTVVVSKGTKGFQFASATWHFSTDTLPKEARGDFFKVSREYFKREKGPGGAVLKPMADGAKLEPGDELEVQLSLTAKQEAEFVHLRDPRGAGFEPENAVSRYRWDLGVGRYEEYRDSGTNFFFEHLPPGQYTFKYRVRAATAGTFRLGPATVQSMYAPEFTAYSQGHVLAVAQGGK